jgi:RNA polymerase sigma factor (sigma-70 family)
VPDRSPRAGGIFPETQWSAIRAARSDDPSGRRFAFDRITAAYWKPVYKYIRTKWNKSREDAEDLTQEFFARVLEKDFFASYDPGKARFRTFLRVCVDAVVQNDNRAAGAQKRGGHLVTLSLDFEIAEGELHRSGMSSADRPDAYFEREWVRSLFEIALDRLRSECESRGRASHFRIFECYELDQDSERISYKDLAREFGIATTDVTNYLALVRKEFRRIALDLLREITSDDDEFRREVRVLLR